MSADSLQLQFESDAQQFTRSDKDMQNLEAAVGYWIGYPTFVEVIQHHPEWPTSEKYVLRYALAATHHAAVQVLMRAAERMNLDSGALWEEGRVCRELFEQPPVGDANHDLWPDCLGSVRYTLPEAMQVAIQEGEAAFMRLVALLEISPKSLHGLHEQRHGKQMPMHL